MKPSSVGSGSSTTVTTQVNPASSVPDLSLPSNQAPLNLEGAFFFPYDAIVKKWESFLGWRGVTKGYPKKFLSQTSLINGSPEAKGHPVWGQKHVFYKGTDSSSGVINLYFIDSDISSLLDILLSKQPSLSRESLLPNPTRRVAFSSFNSLTAITFNTTDELKDFRSKSVNKTDAMLLSLNKKAFEMFGEMGKGTVMAIDMESWERNHAYILEIGWSTIAFQKKEGSESGEVVETRSCEHIIISDYLNLRNGVYTEDNRHRFNFGQSQELSLKKALSLLSSLIDTHTKTGPLFLIFHNASAEVAYFATLGLDTTQWVTGLPDPSFWNDPIPPAEGELRLRDGIVYIIDTQKLFAASGLDGARKQIGLKNALEALGVPFRNMHNAGNDACYTLAVYETLVGSGTLREEFKAEDAARKAKINPKGRQRDWSGWE